MYVKEEIVFEKIIEKSRFICYLKSLKSEDEYKEYLSSIKKKHHDASHVCSAFISNNIRRSSDDGEPSGTAGIPILSTLEKANLNETCALVVRYFGGIKLGAGGLIRAYSSTVSDTIKKARIVEDVIYPKYRIKVDYSLANKLDSFFRKNTLELDKTYDEEVIIDFILNNQDLLEELKDLSKGKDIEYLGDKSIQKDVII